MALTATGGGLRLAARTRGLGRAGLSAPTVVLIAVLLGGPLVYLLLYSFGFFSVIGLPPGPEAWQTFFSTAYYTDSIWSSLQVAGLTTAICLVLGYPIALALSVVRSAWVRRLVVLALFVPLFTSVVSRAYGWELLLGSSGPLEALLRPFGISDPNLVYHLPGVIIALVHIQLPFMVYPLLGSMGQIDPQAVQAARDLGAGPLRRFATVVLPLSLPGAVSGCQLVFALAISSFSTVSLLGGGRVRILATVIYDDVSNVRWATAAVGCFVLLVLTLAALAVFSVIGRIVRYRPMDTIGGAVGSVASRAARIPAGVWLAIVAVFMLAPLVLVVIGSFSSVAYGAWPPPGFSLKWYANLGQQAALPGAIGLSLAIAVLAAVLSTIVGTTTALVVSRPGTSARREAAWSRVLDTATMAPNVVPKVALGFSAYIFLNTLHLLPGISAVVAEHLLITLPFGYIVMRAALSRADRSIEWAARDLGVGRVRAFLSATVPQVAASLAAAALFAFIISFDEVDMTIFMLPPGVQTTSVWMYTYLQRYQDPTLGALSSILIVAVLLLLGAGALILRAARRRGRATPTLPGV